MIATRRVEVPICMGCVSVCLRACGRCGRGDLQRSGPPPRMPRRYSCGHLWGRHFMTIGIRECIAAADAAQARWRAASGRMSAVVARSKGGIMAGIVVDRVYERRLAALV